MNVDRFAAEAIAAAEARDAMGPLEKLTSALEMVNEVIADCNDWWEEVGEVVDRFQLAHACAAALDCLDGLQHLDRQMRTAMNDRIDGDVFMWEGWAFERRPPLSTTQWDVDRLMGALREAAKLYAFGFELEPAEALEKVLTDVVPATASTGFRVQALRRLGINPDTFRTVTTGARGTARVKRPK